MILLFEKKCRLKSVEVREVLEGIVGPCDDSPEDAIYSSSNRGAIFISLTYIS